MKEKCSSTIIYILYEAIKNKSLTLLLRIYNQHDRITFIYLKQTELPQSSEPLVVRFDIGDRVHALKKSEHIFTNDVRKLTLTEEPRIDSECGASTAVSKEIE